MTNKMDAEFVQETDRVTKLLDRLGVPYYRVDDEDYTLDWWTTQDVINIWRKRKESLDDSRDFLIKMGHVPGQLDPQEYAYEARRALWAAGEAELFLYKDLPYEAMHGVACVIKDFQAQALEALVHLVHAMGGDSEESRQALYWYTSDPRRNDKN